MLAAIEFNGLNSANATLNLARMVPSGLVELSDSEIAFVDGGIKWAEVGQAAFVGMVSGAFGGAVGGAVVGAMAGGVGAAPGAFTGFVGGAIGGAVTGAVVSVMSQSGL